MTFTTQAIKDFWNDPAYHWVKNILLFFILLFSFHYLYLIWVNFDYYPFRHQIDQLFNWSSQIVFDQSVWVLEHIFGIDVQTKGRAIWVVSQNGNPTYVSVSPDCTSLKQWMHWIFLMVLFPGPWKQKLWFIPAGLIVIHFLNDFRIFGLALSLIWYPDDFHFFHDYIFRPFFYVMIFLMWVVWVEWIAKGKKR